MQDRWDGPNNLDDMRDAADDNADTDGFIATDVDIGPPGKSALSRNTSKSRAKTHQPPSTGKT